MDEQQIGGGSGEAMSGQTSAQTANATGPLEQRIISKNWSIRAGAFDELTELCKHDNPNSKSDHYKVHSGQWKVYLKDSNPGALEKALDCLKGFLDKIHSSILVPDQNSIILMLVEKCIGHAKPNIKSKAQECLLMIFEVGEDFDESMDTFNELLTHKNIKVLTCGTQAVALLVENFGVKKIKIANYAVNMLKNAQNTNPACKNAAYDYYKGVYKWIGDAILPQIEEKLKKSQMDDLKKAFEEVKAKGNKDKILTRKEASAAKEAAMDEAIDAATAEEKEEEVIDVLEFAPEVDVMSKFGGEWIDATAGTKPWQDKVKRITEIVDACKNVKIKPGNVESLAVFLKKEIIGTNINIAMAAMDAGTALAKGMKKDFVKGAMELIGAFLVKYKEKRPMVLEKLKAFLEAVVLCANFEELGPNMIPCVTNAAPGVQKGAVEFVEALTLISYIDVLQKVAPELMPPMVKQIDAKDGGVRDAALHAVGILKGRLGDAIFTKYLKDGAANPQKTAKILEASKEVKPTKYDRPENYKPPVKKAPKKEPENDDDALMSMDMGPPKRKPPANIGKKPPSKLKKKVEEKVEDEEMKNEEESPPPKKAPPPKTAAKSTKAAPSTQVIVDESGEGIDKAEAVEKVEGHFSNTDKFNSAKWQDKQEGFKSLQEQILDQNPDVQMLEAIAKFVKAKMKDFKESNINLMKEIIATFSCIAQNCDAINKRTFQVGMSFFIDKIGDVKMSVAIKEMLIFAAEKVSPKFISLQTIKYGTTAKAPKNIQESCVLLTTICDDFGVSGIPLKESIDFAKIAAAHATPAVRQSAIKFFCELFRHAGEGIRSFMDDIKESTLKVIDAELKSCTQYAKGEHEKKRFWVGAPVAKEGPKGKAVVEEDDDPFASLPREDISKKLTSKLLEQFAHKDWKIRKKGGEDIEAILKEAKMRIQDTGLGGLMEVFKNGMKDANKAVLKIYINLLGMLAEAVGAPIKQFTKKCLVPSLKHLAYKDTLVRAEVVSTMTKWAEVIGAENIINKVSLELVVENPELRTEGLNWIQKNKDSIKDADKVSMVKPFISCLTDKSKVIRDQTEALICEFMPSVGYSEFSLKDFKPAVQQTLKPILERIKSNCGATNQPQKEGDVPAPKAPEPKKKVVEEEKKAEAPPPNSFAKKASEQKQKEKSAKPAREVSKSPEPSPKKPMDSSRGGKKAVELGEDDLAIVATEKNKEKRANVDSRTKYPMNEVKGDHVEKLQNQCQDAFGLKFHDLMFAKAQDFKKHIGCVEKITKTIDNQYDELNLVLDIIFKWSNLRMAESSNTQLAVSIFDFYKKLLPKMIENEQQLQEFEMLVLLGTLCDKSGVNNKHLQESIRKLIRMCYELYDNKGCLRIIIDSGLKNKNLKSVAECLDEMADYIQKHGVDHLMKKDYKLLIDLADNKDKGVRETSLKVFGEAYTVLGEKIWTFLKDIPLKVKGLLEQRFKTVAKKVGTTGLASSINSNKPGNLAFNKGDKKRDSIAPGLTSSLGGVKGLNFNKDKTPTKEKEVQQEKDIVDQMEEMDPFNQKIKNEPECDDGDTFMKDEQRTQMRDVFAGKAQKQDEDQEMEQENDNIDDEAAVVQTPAQKRTEMKAAPAQSFNREVPNSNVNEFQGRVPMNEDDDLIAKALKDAERDLESDPALRDQKIFILSHIAQLRDGDLLKRVDSLVLLNEVISATSAQNQAESPNMSQELLNQQKALIHCCNDLINAFTHVMDDIFKHPVQDIPLRFTKYFITIVNKTCTSKEIMTEVSEKSVHDLVEQLLTRLLIDNLDKIGQNKEGELILKNLNSSMIRMLENCNHTYVFGVLFGLLKKFQNDNSLPKMHGLIIKCLLKLNKIMHRLIEKLDMQKFLISIHEYLVIIDHNNRTQNDDLGIRIVKTLINEIVKLKGESIWQSYEVIRQHPSDDNHIEKWILIILKSLQLNQNSAATEQPQQRSATVTEYEFKKILIELRDPQKYDNAIQRLAKFAQNYPQYNYQEKLKNEQAFFANKVLNSLEKFKNGNSWKSTNNSDSIGAGGQTQQPQDQQKTQADLNRSLGQKTAFESKMAKFKRTSVAGIGAPGGNIGSSTNRNTTAAGPTANNLNSSFSVMNQKIADRWDNMKMKKNVGGQTVRSSMAPVSNLSQTMNAGAGGVNQLNTSNNKFTSKFASKIQQKTNEMQTPGQGGNSSLGGMSGGNAFQSRTSMPIQQPQAIQSQQQKQEASGAAKSGRIGGGGGISNNSFRSRLQGLGSNAAQTGVSAQTSVPQSTPGSSGAATHQDLKQRLDQMKMKMQALKKDK